MATADELVRIDGQAHEILKRVANGSLDAKSVRKTLQDIIEGKLSQDARFDGNFLTINQQLELLKRYNSQYWEGKLDTPLKNYAAWVSDHEQRIDDLEILHVQFDSLEETVEMWWRVMVGEQPDSWRWDELKFDSEHLRLLGSNVRHYEPGIHLVRINLVAHWEFVSGRTLEEVRERARRSDEILAQLEVMSAYGLHTELMREQDGEILPYSDMAGIDVSVPGASELHALCAYWNPFGRQAGLGARWVGGRRDRWAAPVLRES